MAHISIEEVKKVAELARLKCTTAEIESYQKDLEKILASFESLSKIPIPEELKGDQRSAISLKSTQTNSDSVSRMRQDKPENSVSTQAFLAQAPDREGVFLRVPAILEKST